MLFIDARLLRQYQKGTEQLGSPCIVTGLSLSATETIGPRRNTHGTRYYSHRKVALEAHTVSFVLIDLCFFEDFFSLRRFIASLRLYRDEALAVRRRGRRRRIPCGLPRLP